MANKLISGNNDKINTKSFNLPAHASCPGASDWCKSHCYASKGRYVFGTVRKMYKRNLRAVKEGKSTFSRLVAEIPKEGVFRIHSSGDFFSVNYIQMWIDICKSKSDIKFWGYTRSWIIPELRDKLEELRSLSNVEIFASIDPTVLQIPPKGWRVASVEGDDRYTGITCPEQLAKKKGLNVPCTKCKFCFDKNRKGRNVIFLEH